MNVCTNEWMYVCMYVFRHVYGLLSEPRISRGGHTRALYRQHHAWETLTERASDI